MFCSKCGKEIDDEAIVCVGCGCGTKNAQTNNSTNNTTPPPVIINNAVSSSASASASAGGRIRRHRSVALDIFLIIITCGLWIIWMLIRPKYY